MPTDDLVPLLPALRSGDPAIERRFFNAYLPRLTAILHRHFPIMPEEAVIDAAADALLELMVYSERYDPQMGSLLNYLVHIGEHKLLDELRRLKRRRENYVGGNVELALVETNQFREADYPEPSVQDPDTLPADVQVLLEEILPDTGDREALALVLQGRTSIDQFAAVWKFDALPSASQAKLVKQNRDRILKKVKRRQQEFRRLLYGDN